MKHLKILLFAAALVVPVSAPAARPNTLTPEELSDGWILLFDGQTLFGWKAMSQVDWSVVDGVLKASQGEPGLLRTTAQWGNFVLKVDFRSAKGTNSGVFLRTDPEGDQIYYLFDWGDDTDSTWIGPYPSGATAEASHAWTTQGSYEIKVIAKDEDDALSEWSDSMPVSLGALCGDPNEDGVTNVGDVVYLVSYLYKAGPSPQPTDCVGDANSDDIVNVGDIVYLVAYLYGGGPAPDPNCCNPPWK